MSRQDDLQTINEMIITVKRELVKRLGGRCQLAYTREEILDLIDKITDKFDEKDENP